MSKPGRSHDNGISAALRRWRRHNRNHLNNALARAFGTTQPKRGPLAPDTRRILVMRLNKRLGNILFLTPMLRTLAASLPNASIDIVIRNPAQKPLLETLPGVNNVYVQNSGVTATWRTLRTIRKQRYDLAIDPVDNSASNRIGTALVRARQRMGFATSDQWLRLTHACPEPESLHQGLQSIELLTKTVTAPELKVFDVLSVLPSAADQKTAASHWRALFAESAPERPVVGFFSHATGDKVIPRTWWQSWLQEMRQATSNVQFVEILPADDAAPIDTTIACIAIRSLTELAAFMTRVDQFVAADSGPMHLAAAAGAPVVGLFKSTSPARYAPLGRGCTTVEGEDLEPSHVADLLAERLARQPGPSASQAKERINP